MIIDKEGNEYIEHFGRIGMKWGVKNGVNSNFRKGVKLNTRNQYQDMSFKNKLKDNYPKKDAVNKARSNHEKTVKKVQKLSKTYAKMPGSAPASDAIKVFDKIDKILNSKQTMTDIRVGSRVSAGKEFALRLTTGVVGSRVRYNLARNKMADQLNNAIERPFNDPFKKP